MTNRRCTLYMLLKIIILVQIVSIIYILIKQVSTLDSELTSKRTKLISNKTKIQKIIRKDQFNVHNPSYKIYIVDLPDRFNKDILRCLQFNKTQMRPKWIKYEGFGPQRSQDHVMSIRDTWQFSLELIIHHKLKTSLYRTLNESEADVFYLPFYAGLSTFCQRTEVLKGYYLFREFYKFIKKLKHFRDRKPFFMAIGKIEREMRLLNFKEAVYLTYIGIEQEVDVKFRKKTIKSSRPLIVAPYPSFGHFLPGVTEKEIEHLYRRNERSIFILFAGKDKPGGWDGIRSKVLQGLIKIKTTLNYTEYHHHHGHSEAKSYKMKGVFLGTFELRDNGYLASWMRKSVFCLQPAGDTPTRKSFYDAIMCGCIPVIFTYKDKVKYPFEHRIDYKKLTVTINSTKITGPLLVQNILSKIDKKILYEKQYYMYTVMKYLQYSYPIKENTKHEDAMQYILDELGSEVLKK